MTVRTRIIVDADAFNQRTRFINRYNRLVQETVERVARDTEQATLEAMRQDPGPVQYPIQWTSDKQRIAVMIKLRKLAIEQGRDPKDGIEYRRTGTINQWFYETAGSGANTGIVLGNKTPYLKYVRGSLSESRFLRNRQQFHANTGWTAVKPIADERMRIAQDEVIKSLDESAGLLGRVDVTRQNR